MTVSQMCARFHVYNRLGRELIKPVICMNDHCGGDSSHKWKKIQVNESCLCVIEVVLKGLILRKMFFVLIRVGCFLLNAGVF